MSFLTRRLGIDALREDNAKAGEALSRALSQGAAQAKTIEHMRARIAEAGSDYLKPRSRLSIRGHLKETAGDDATGQPLSEGSRSGYSVTTARYYEGQAMHHRWRQIADQQGYSPRSIDIEIARLAWYDNWTDAAGNKRLFPTSKNLTNLHSDYCFGDGVEAPVTDNEAAMEQLSEWWWHPDNQACVFSGRAQEQLSAKLLVEGEIFFAVFPGGAGWPVQVRILDPLEMSQPIVHPEDSNKVLYWERRWRDISYNPQEGRYELLTGEEERRLYYPALGNVDGGVYDDPYADDPEFMSRIAPAKVYHLTRNTMTQTDRGVGIFLPMIDWELMIVEICEDQSTISQATGALMAQLVVEGGQDNVDAAVAFYGQSGDNPSTHPSNVGDMNVMNDAADMKISRASTGAGDAAMNARLFLRQLCQGAGVAPHYAGDPENAGLATAHTMEGPQLKHFKGYQGTWADAYTALGAEVLHEANIAPEDADLLIPMPPLIHDDILQRMQAITSMFEQDFATRPQATLMAHTAMGAADPTSEAEKALEEYEEGEEQRAADEEQAEIERNEQLAVMQQRIDQDGGEIGVDEEREEVAAT